MSLKSGLLLFIVLLAAVIILIFSFYYISSLKTKSQFSAIIEEADKSIISDDYSAAEDLLKTAKNLNLQDSEYKILLKRLFNIRSFKLLEDISEIAVEKYPKDKIFPAVYFYSLLKLDENKAAGLYSKVIESLNIPDSLYLEAIIKSGTDSLSDSPFYKATFSRDPVIYRKLFGITNNSIFRVNESLLYLEQGKLDLAQDSVKNIDLNTPIINQLKFLMLYDSGDYKASLKLLNLIDNNFDLREMQLFELDIYLRMGQYDLALDGYSSFVKLYPDYTWIAYYNYIWLELYKKNFDIIFLIKNALNTYPDNRFLLYELVKYYKENGSKNEAISFLEKYLKTNPDDSEMKIILQELKGITNTKYLVTSLRTFVNDNPSSNQAASYLAWNLIENRQFAYLEKLLAVIDKGMSQEWISFFNAMIFVEKGEFESAVKAFQLSYQLKPRWQTLYNIALTSEYMPDYNTAVDYYQKAENSLSDIDNITLKASIRTQLALLLFKMKEYQSSYREILNALDQDKNNLKAHLLLKKLETVTF